MSQALLYSKAPCSLKAIANTTCPAGVKPDDYEASLLSTNPRIANAGSTVVPLRPTILTAGGPQRATNMHRIQSCSVEQQRVLSDLSLYAGGTATLGLASLLWDTKIPDIVGDLNTFGGNGMGAAVAKSSPVLSAIAEYDEALKYYEDLANHRAAPRTLKAAKERVERAFEYMNRQFNRAALPYLNNSEFKMRKAQTVTGKEVWESIPVRDNADVIKLEKFTKAGRILGPGMVAFDGYLRANKVYHMRKENHTQWKREAFIQSGAFGAGIAAGVVIGATIGITPVGIVIALVAGGIAGVTIDRIAQTGLGHLHDLLF
ncbi:hypothetical protein [Halioxenophilus aromaticivorans]|uniref:Uncharacterized protein n=1 Tax=Halioxenophilus aromaticivorans TaxID=1306992 RepID=A0AAV3TZX0_9ALTE